MTEEINNVWQNVINRCVNSVYNVNGPLGYAYNHLLIATTKKYDVSLNRDFEWHLLRYAFKQTYESHLPSNSSLVCGHIIKHKVRKVYLPKPKQIKLRQVSMARNSDSDTSKSQMLKNVGLPRIPEYMCAKWLMCIMTDLILKQRRSPGSALRRCIRIARNHLLKRGVKSNLWGVSISVSGKLTKQKQGKTKKYSTTIGNITPNSMSSKLDYDQSMITTRRGLVGIKIWLGYK